MDNSIRVEKPVLECVQCPTCEGDGSDPFQKDRRCLECGGAGKVPIDVIAIDDRVPHLPQKPPRPRAVEIAERLAAPFSAEEVEYKPGPISGNRAMALAYIDARAVMNRLDAVLGIDGWQASFEFLPGGCAKCRLSIRIGDAIGAVWITKEDVGGPSDQSDHGDRAKAAVSDALKRAAVHFGIGRFLYALTPEWKDWDAQRKCFVSTPVPCLSKAQVAEINKLLTQTHTDVQKFLGWARAESVAKVAGYRYQEALAFLQMKANGKQ